MTLVMIFSGGFKQFNNELYEDQNPNRIKLRTSGKIASPKPM